MIVLVTGGSGFAGGRLVTHLVEGGHEVHALARSAESADRVAALGATPVRGDLADLADGPPAWTAVLSACDAVVHAAAYMEFWGPDRVFEERNLRPTVALHEAAVRAGVRRFVLISAASVSSGTQRAPVVDEDTDEGRPNLAYSRAKLAAERALLAAPSAATETVVLRPPFVWGAGMSTLDQIVSAVQHGQFAWVDGGRHLVDFVHVDNLAHACVLALDHGRPGGVYYVTDGAPRPAREFMGALMETRGVTPPERSVPRPAAAVVATLMEAAFRLARRDVAPPLTRWVVAWLGRDRSYDITRARTELGYEPVVAVEDGVARMGDPAAADRAGATPPGVVR
jgi:nucleoside-diphosphate-sugar epimerase